MDVHRRTRGGAKHPDLLARVESRQESGVIPCDIFHRIRTVGRAVVVDPVTGWTVTHRRVELEDDKGWKVDRFDLDHLAEAVPGRGREGSDGKDSRQCDLLERGVHFETPSVFEDDVDDGNEPGVVVDFEGLDTRPIISFIGFTYFIFSIDFHTETDL